MAGAAAIDTVNRVVTLPLGEEADINAVRVLTYLISPSDAHMEGTMPQTLNLGEKPYEVTLALYQSYTWSIRATQSIERRFSVSGQVGAATIDVPAHRVVAYVPEGADLAALEVTSIKLGSTVATMSPDLQGRKVDFTSPVEVTVTDHGRSTTWTIFVEETDAVVTLTSVDAWTRVAWLYASAEAGKSNGFEYRLKGSTEWTPVPAEWVTADGGSFSARLIHLSPSTAYEARAVSDLDVTEAVEFSTDSEAQMPNSGFEEWWLDGRLWCPWAQDGTPYWGSGNKGTITMPGAESNTTPCDTTATGIGNGYSARLLTKFVGVGALGKLAAGSIFAGLYFKTDGTNGILHMGREFDKRPTRVSGYLKYRNALITDVGSDADFRDWKGRPDTAIVWASLIDTPQPFEVRTNPKNRQLFDPKGDYVVAYGSVQYGESVEEWIPFSVELNYTSTSRVPRYIIVTASASKYGDYFVGGRGGVLYVDDLTLEYDY